MKTSVAILLSLLRGVNSWHSSSFSPRTTLQRNNENLKPLQASKSHIDTVDSTSSTETYFWSKDRTEDEIIQFCARSLFPREEFSVARERIEVVSAELPLIVIHNFLHKDLCEEIIDVARQNGNMKRSTMGELTSLKIRFWFNLRFNFIDRLLVPLSLLHAGNSQKVSETRTSSTTWLREKQCEIPLTILGTKISRLTGIPSENCENFQVVRYNGNGEKFDMHTDHLDSFNDLDLRGRLATCLLYLNSASGDNETSGFKGGCTHFPEYNAEVKPEQGSVAFWFNTIERPTFSDTSERGIFSHDSFLSVDLRSRHAGTPVVGGEKWVCNRWVHPVPFQNSL